MSTSRVRDHTSENSQSSSTALEIGSTNEPLPKSSTVRFTPETIASSKSAKPSRHTPTSSDETTPIKKSDTNLHRGYNTAETTLPVSLSLPTATASRVSTTSGSSATLHTEADAPWYRRVADKYGSMVLENKASVARDHLALERTFLAWLRTSLSFASIGIAITQLFRLNSTLTKGSSVSTSQVLANTMNNPQSFASVPFSPYLGHSLPADILPYLQNMVLDSGSDTPRTILGPTLLDQLLHLSPDGKPIRPSGHLVTGFDYTSADKLKHVGKPLGATFIGISVVVLLVGFQRYFEAQHWIIHGKFPASRGSISLVAFAAFALIIASLVVVVVVSPDSFES